MEGTCHEWVVIRRIAEHHELGATQGTLVLGSLGSILHDFTQQAHGVHVDSGLGRTHVHGTADEIGLCHRLRDGTDEEFIALAHTLAHDGRVAAQEVDTQLLGTLVQGLGYLHVVVGGLAGRTAYQGDRSDGDALVDDRHTVFLRNILTSLHQVLGKTGYLVIDVFTELVEIGSGTIQEVDTHGDGAHVEVLLLNHLVGFYYLRYIDHFPSIDFKNE